ncbi:MAG: hypothetical protein IKE43_10180 [Coriobacteriales bacterium]|nr:hypothetical protein [Coriobacteriales bacterium]
MEALQHGMTLNRRSFVAMAGLCLCSIAAGQVERLFASEDEGYEVNDVAPYGVSVPYSRLASRHAFEDPVFEAGMHYSVYDAATGLTYKFYANEPFVANPVADMCYAVGGPAYTMLTGFTADESAASFAAKVHLANHPAAKGAATIHDGPGNVYISQTFLQVELDAEGVHDGYIGEFAYLQVVLDEDATPDNAVVYADSWMELHGASAPQETITGIIDTENAGLTPLEKQVIARAQELYDNAIDTYGSVNGYVSAVKTRKQYYDQTLGQAKWYNQVYKTVCNFSEAFICVAVGAIQQNPGKIASPLLDMLADEAIEQSFLNEVSKKTQSMGAVDFVYSQATLGSQMIRIGGLRDVMEPAQNNGGRFANAADAARFILVYQRNEAGFAALGMGRSFYMDQLNKGPLETLNDILLHLVISLGVGELLPDDWATGYISGKALENLENRLDTIVTKLKNPHVTARYNELLRIERETRAIFTAPLYYTVSRKDGLMGEPTWWGEKQTPTPQQLEELGCYTGFDPAPGLSKEAAAAFLKIVDDLINQYGPEYIAYDSSNGTYDKNGLTGGYITDLNADGVPEMLVVYRRKQSWLPDQTKSMQYEFWTWEYNQPFKIFFGELEYGEYLNIWEGQGKQYLEMGYSGEASDHWFMELSSDRVFGRCKTPPTSAQMTRRIPVGQGERAYLANSDAFIKYLANTAAGLAQNDPTSVFDLVRYVGDPTKCAMGANRARAYADSTAADFHPDVNDIDSRFLQAILVDAGEDGYPLLIKFIPNSYYLLDEEGTHFISDAILCWYHEGQVREYPFIEQIGYISKPGYISVSLISPKQRGGGVPVLLIRMTGWVLGGEESGAVDAYYFCDQGKLTLFHTMLQVYGGYNEDTWYWDGEECFDPDAALYAAALDYTGYPKTFFAMNFADQNAGPGTYATIMETMLRAYAASGVPDEDIVYDPVAPDPGFIWYERYGKRTSVNFGTSLARLIKDNIPTEYSPHLAYVFAVLAASAYNESDINESLRNLGLFSIEQRNYYTDHSDPNYPKDGVAFSIATGKTVDGRPLVCVPIRGTYGPIEEWSKDWASDFNLGLAGIPVVGNSWHQGFKIASQEVFDAISHGSNKVDKSATYVICGHSRGGGVGNLLAVRLRDAGVSKENIYCYNFACPDTARGAFYDWNTLNQYSNIWNIGRPADPVTLVPGIADVLTLPTKALSGWGKFGNSYWYTPDWDNTNELIPDLSFAPHYCEGYIDILSKEPSLKDMHTWSELVALLPLTTSKQAFTDLANFIQQHAT